MGNDLEAHARSIIDANVYMTLGTADAGGQPWANPVYFAHDQYRHFYWISSPQVTHSRNLAVRPELSIVVFDSRVPPGSGVAAYMSGAAREVVAPGEIDRGLEVYPRLADRGAWSRTAADLRPPATYRLYRATVSRRWVLCPRESGPCQAHGNAFDHRIEVAV